jgi:membrane protease YdiL (CAAX protease family)
LQARLIEKTSFAKYGLHIKVTWMTEFLVGCCIAAVQLIIFYGIMYFSGNLSIESYFWMPPDVSYSFAAGFLSETFSQLIGSMGEELFFRSFLFYLVLESLRHLRKEPLSKAMLTSLIISLLFGLAHYTNESATLLSTVNLAIDGLMLAIPFLITGRLGMSIGIHFSWNLLLGAVLGAGVSGNLAKVSVIRMLTPDNLFTGGAFGPEGSVLVLLLDLIAVGIIFLWWKTQKQKSLLSPMIVDSASDANLGLFNFKLKTV